MKSSDAIREPVDLTVVVINYNVRDFLEHALASVERASAGLDCEVIVVDNNSADGSVEMVQERFRDFICIANTENVGFGRANNQALRIARGRAILLLNPDTVVQEDTFREMLAFLDAHPQAGAVGCMILNPDGSFARESRRSFPTPSVAVYRLLGLSRLFPRSRRFGRYNMTYKAADEATEVDALSGSCMMIRRAALAGEYGDTLDPSVQPRLLFDERFFMYGEDLDLCYRIQSGGWKLYYSPTTRIIHYKGESTRKGDLKYIKLFYGAMLMFAEKHFHDRYSVLFRIVLRAGILIRGALSAAWRIARNSASAVIDFLLVGAVVALVAFLRVGELTTEITFTVAPVYALAAVLTMAALGAYRQPRMLLIRHAVAGAGVALLVVAALSFFVKQIAFSRLVVAASAPAAVLVLVARHKLLAGRTEETPAAILVGTPEEATRVRDLIARNPAPPFALRGYVGDAATKTETGGPPRLGGVHQLRDVVRFNRPSVVVFAAGSYPRIRIFGWMQELRGLPVTFRMLDTRESFVVGKSGVSQLAIGSLVDARAALGIKQRAWSHRAFDVGFALLCLLAAPVVILGAAFGIRPFRRALRAVRRLPSVIAGRRAVVGFNEHARYRPPEKWGIRPGIVPVVPRADVRRSDEELESLYVHYAMNQSATTDWAIVLRAWQAARRGRNGNRTGAPDPDHTATTKASNGLERRGPR